MAGRIENLKPWPKGVSGNPKGRPKYDISAEIARAVFENNAEVIYTAMVRRLIKGDVRAFKILAERAYGKVKEHVEPELTTDGLAERLQAARQRMVEQAFCSQGKELGIPNLSVKLLNPADNDEIRTQATASAKKTADCKLNSHRSVQKSVQNVTNLLHV